MTPLSALKGCASVISCWLAITTTCPKKPIDSSRVTATNNELAKKEKHASNLTTVHFSARFNFSLSGHMIGFCGNWKFV